MNYLDRVQRGVDFIEARLDEPIELAEIAEVAGLSQWHFQRIFRGLTSETLKTYVRSRRMAVALERLVTTDLRVLDIAVAAGFESQEAFARAFKKAFGMTPSEYRQIGRKNLFPRKVQFDRDYLRHVRGSVSLSPQVERRPGARLVGLRTLFYSVDSDKNNIADRLPPLWADFGARIHEIPHRVEGLGYGVIRPTRADSDQLEYVAAIEVSEVGAVPDGMVQLELAADDYATFEHRGNPDELDRTVNYIYSSWLPRSKKWHTQGPDLEIYGSAYLAGSKESVMHYAIPIGDKAPPLPK